MDDSEGIGGMLGFQGSDLLGGDDIKSILWDDGPEVSFENLSSEHQGENDMLNLIQSAGMSPSNSSETLQDDSEMNKKLVLAAASAAGLNKGGIRRAAFSMGDLQALQPAEPKQEMQTFSTGLETVHEGQPSLLSALPHVRVVHASHHPHQQQQQQQQQQQFQQPPQQQRQQLQPPPHQQQQQPQQQQQQQQQQHYVLMPLHEAAARGSTPTQLASMSIEEIEAQLRRTREAAAASAEHARPGLVQVPGGMAMPTGSQPMRYYTVMPSTGALQELQPSQLVSLMQQQPSHSGAALHVPVSVPMSVPMAAAHLHAPRTVTMAAAPAVVAPAMSAPSMRRTKSAVDLRPRAGNEEEQQGAAPVALQATVPGEGPIPDDGVYRIGKLTLEERRQKILRYRQKRHERNFKKKIKYVCRKTLADSRPRVRGRFARNTDEDAKMPPATE